MSEESGRQAAPGSLAQPLTLALRDLAFAVRALQLYPSDSPVVADAVSRAHRGLEPFLRGGRLSLVVLPETIRVGPDDAGAGSRTVRDLAGRLHQRGVAHLHVDAGVEASSLQRLAEMLATDADALKEQGGISALCERQQLNGLALEMLQLERLYDDDEDADADPQAAIWESILGSYSDEADLDGIDWAALAEDPEKLADFLGWLLDEESPPAGISEMSRMQLVRAVCERVGEAAAALGDDEVEAVAGVFGRFYDRLDKEVWIDLLGRDLRVGAALAADPGESLPSSGELDAQERLVRAAATELGGTDLATGIGATLNNSQVEDLLVYALSSRKEASPRIFGLFQRLLEERSERDLMEQAIREAIERQAPDEGSRKTFEDLWPQLSDALHGENPDAYVSSTYRASLDNLLDRQPDACLWNLERIQPRTRELEPIYLMQRKAKVLLEILASVLDDEEYIELVGELERALPELIVDGQYISAEEILKALSEDLVPASGRSVAQREAARDVLVRFCNQHTLREVVRNLAGKQRTQIDAATRIFASLGPMAVPALLEALSQERSRPIRAHLVNMLATIGDAALSEIRKHLRDKRWFFVRNLVWIIGEIGDPRFVPHLAIIVNHPDVRVRREAIRSMSKLRNEAAAKVLAGAIDDKDEEVQLLAIRGLGISQARSAVPRLCELMALPNLTGNNTEIIRAAAVAAGRIGDGRALDACKRIARRPVLFRSRRAPAADAATWAVATLQGETAGDAPEARMAREEAPQGLGEGFGENIPSEPDTGEGDS